MRYLNTLISKIRAFYAEAWACTHGHKAHINFIYFLMVFATGMIIAPIVGIAGLYVGAPLAIILGLLALIFIMPLLMGYIHVGYHIISKQPVALESFFDVYPRWRTLLSLLWRYLLILIPLFVVGALLAMFVTSKLMMLITLAALLLLIQLFFNATAALETNSPTGEMFYQSLQLFLFWL